MPVEAIAVTLISYLLGSIPFGVLVARKYGIEYIKLAAETQELMFYEKLENQLAIWFSFLISLKDWSQPFGFITDLLFQ